MSSAPGPNVIVFLKARLDEDEAKAKAAALRKAGFVAHWAEFDTDGGDFLGPFGTFLPDEYQISECDTPEHTLRDIHAKRAIVRDYEDYLRALHPTCLPEDPERSGERHTTATGRALGRVIYRLASVYAGHADYDEGWRLCY